MKKEPFQTTDDNDPKQQKVWTTATVAAATVVAIMAMRFATWVDTHAISKDRTPASIQRVFDFSYLDGRALQIAAKERLMNSLDIKTSTDKSFVSINVGNFVLLDEKNQKDFACGFYDRMSFTFEAEGVSVDGEKPRMIVQSGCEIGGNVNTLVPMAVPLQKILAQKPSNSELKFYDSKNPLTIQLSNVPPEWPKAWVLSEVKFTHSQLPSRILAIAANDPLMAIKPVKMIW